MKTVHRITAILLSAILLAGCATSVEYVSLQFPTAEPVRVVSVSNGLPVGAAMLRNAGGTQIPCARLTHVGFWTASEVWVCRGPGGEVVTPAVATGKSPAALTGDILTGGAIVTAGGLIGMGARAAGKSAQNITVNVDGDTSGP